MDYNGNVYTSNGSRVSAESADFIKTAERGAYLRRIQDGTGLSDAAKQAYLNAGGSAASSAPQATILDTGLGWLRVRDEPGLNGTELTKVNVGEKYEVLEEQSEWVKIKISDDVEGWVSSTYVDIEKNSEATTTTTETDSSQ